MKRLLIVAGEGFAKDSGDLIAAALAFHTLFSLAPLVILSVAIAGFVLGTGTARAEVTDLLMGTMGPRMTRTVNSWVDQASEASEVASVFGVGLVLFAASRLGEQLRNALNKILNVDSVDAAGFRGKLKYYVRRRLFAFLLVLASGPLLVVVFVSRTLLTQFHDLMLPESGWSLVIVQGVQIAFTFALVALGSALVLRVVPDADVGWRPALFGGGLISVLFSLGNLAIGMYLGRSGVGAAYGVASSAVAVLIWLQFSSVVFLFGAECTQVYAAWQCDADPDLRSPPTKDVS